MFYYESIYLHLQAYALGKVFAGLIGALTCTRVISSRIVDAGILLPETVSIKNELNQAL